MAARGTGRIAAREEEAMAVTRRALRNIVVDELVVWGVMGEGLVTSVVNG